MSLLDYHKARREYYMRRREYYLRLAKIRRMEAEQKNVRHRYLEVNG